MVRRYLALAARVPIFALELDRRWERLPAVLDGIERDVIQWHAQAS